jgi:hypothetical protein
MGLMIRWMIGRLQIDVTRRLGKSKHAHMDELAGRLSQNMTQLFLVGLRGFPGQALGPQSFVVFLEGFLRFFVFRHCLSLSGSLKSLQRLSLGGCEREVLACPVAHGSPPIQ